MLSGGLDSAVLAAQEARTYVVHPVYVAGGLAWEEGEQHVIGRLLSSPPFNGSARVMPLARLEFSMRDVYPPSHWAMQGTPPAYDTPDEDVYLHGRNIALLSKAAVYAASRRISRIVVAPLAGNPFPDATPQFFAALKRGVLAGPGRADRDQRAVRRSAQRGCGENRRRTRGPVRADAVVHEPVRHDALRVVQQVPRAKRRIPGGRGERPHHVHERQSQMIWNKSGNSPRC